MNIKNLSMTLDCGRKLFENLSFELRPRHRIGIVGANGTGKSTLLRIIHGDQSPDSGSVEIGDTIRVGFVSQSRDDMDPKNTVYREIAQGEDEIVIGEDGQTVKTRAYVAAFNLRGQAQEKMVKSLSGGELNRVRSKQISSTMFVVRVTPTIQTKHSGTSCKRAEETSHRADVGRTHK